MTTPSQTLQRIAATVFFVAAVVVSVPAPAQAWTDGVCTDTSGITLIVDFQTLGGETIIRCVTPTPDTGGDVITEAGLELVEVSNSPGFICRIAGEPSTDPCVNTPPSDAYWSYWHADHGGTWSYSTLGAFNYHPTPGRVEAWSFSTDPTDFDGTPPRIDPPTRPAPLPPTVDDPVAPSVPSLEQPALPELPGSSSEPGPVAPTVPNSNTGSGTTSGTTRPSTSSGSSSGTRRPSTSSSSGTTSSGSTSGSRSGQSTTGSTGSDQTVTIPGIATRQDSSATGTRPNDAQQTTSSRPPTTADDAQIAALPETIAPSQSETTMPVMTGTPAAAPSPTAPVSLQQGETEEGATDETNTPAKKSSPHDTVAGGVLIASLFALAAINVRRRFVGRRTSS